MNTLSNDFGKLDKYQITFNKITGTWRILDIQNESIKKIQNFDLEGVDIDIPDDSPAVTILTDAMFSKLIATAIKEGVLDESVVGLGKGSSSDNKLEIESLKHDIENYQEMYNEQTNKMRDLEKYNNTLREEIQKNSGTESYKLKSQIINTLSKLAVAENINEIERISR